MNQYLTALGITEAMIAARGLHEFDEAAELEITETAADGRQHLLVPTAAAWRRLKAAAARWNLSLSRAQPMPGWPGTPPNLVTVCRTRAAIVWGINTNPGIGVSTKAIRFV